MRQSLDEQLARSAGQIQAARVSADPETSKVPASTRSLAPSKETAGSASHSGPPVRKPVWPLPDASTATVSAPSSNGHQATSPASGAPPGAGAPSSKAAVEPGAMGLPARSSTLATVRVYATPGTRAVVVRVTACWLAARAAPPTAAPPPPVIE